MNTASEIAKYIVHTFQEAGDPVDNLKLQKLLYYVQGWHLAVTGGPAFQQPLEAWVHGPVQPGVYGEYKHYRWNPINQEVKAPELPESLRDVIQEVLDAYGGDSGYELELRTHREPPWLLARGGIPEDQESHAVITHPSMELFFRGLMDGKGAN
jgi:uncharacterized phage-associated protein